MKRKSITKALISLMLLVSVAFTSLAALPASAATVSSDNSVSAGWKCSVPKIDASSIHQRGQSIGFRWNKVSGANRYRVFYKDNGGTWRKLGDTIGNLWYDRELKRTCMGGYYTVRCVSDDGKTFISDYQHSGTWIKATYYSTPCIEHVQKINWNKAYIFFEGNPNVIRDGNLFQLYMKKGKNGKWTRIKSRLERWEETPEMRTDYDGADYYPMCYRAEITNDSVPYPGETYYYTVRCVGFGNKLLDNGKVGFGEIFTSMYNDNNAYYIHHPK